MVDRLWIVKLGPVLPARGLLQHMEDPMPHPTKPQDDQPSETRPQQAGEGDTTRFGMEDGDNTDTPATGLDPEAQSKPSA